MINLFQDLKISSKLYFGFGVVILLAVIVAVSNFNNYSEIEESTHHNQELVYPILKDATNMVIATIQVQQWCSDISATQGKDGFDDGLVEAQKSADEFYEKLAHLKSIATKHAELFDEMYTAFQNYHATGIEMANAYIAQGPAGGNKLMPEFDGASEVIQELVWNYYNIVENEFKDGLEEIEIKSSNASYYGLIFSVFGIILGSLIAFFISRSISKPLTNLTQIAQKLSIGDTEHVIEFNSKDEIGDLANAYRNMITYMKDLSFAAEKIASNDLTVVITPKSEKDVLGNSFKKMVSNFSNMIGQIKNDTQQLVAAASNIDSASKKLNEGSGQVSNNVNASATASEEISTNMNSVAASVEQMSSNIKSLSGSAEEMSSSVHNVSAAVEEFSSTLAEVTKNSSQTATIAKQADETAKSASGKMSSLAENATQIGKIVSSITDIADLTNLLALNATIEAASAGDAGKGFAVVANEVKELAKQTASATAEITQQVEKMQGDTDEAVKAIADILKVNNEINELSASVATAIEQQSAAVKEISQSITISAKGAENVSTNSKELAQGTNEISRFVIEASTGASGIAKDVSNAATATNDMNSNIEDLNNVARELKERADSFEIIVGEFKI